MNMIVNKMLAENFKNASIKRSTGKSHHRIKSITKQRDLNNDIKGRFMFL